MGMHLIRFSDLWKGKDKQSNGYLSGKQENDSFFIIPLMPINSNA
jgi:hypothetical protein